MRATILRANASFRLSRQFGTKTLQVLKSKRVFPADPDQDGHLDAITAHQVTVFANPPYSMTQYSTSATRRRDSLGRLAIRLPSNLLSYPALHAHQRRQKQ